VIGMFGFGFALVPLYDVFCDVTGLNGKTGSAVSAESLEITEDTRRTVTIEFDSSLNSYLNLSFEPEQRSMQVHPGRLYTTAYFARNETGRDMVGQAIPSVLPGPAAVHLKKTECFCFRRQAFASGEGREMPVTFYIDPKLPDDISRITLSYTFFDVSDTAMN
jgi:cytochrome c oxidase assembly protein subunit 11